MFETVRHEGRRTSFTVLTEKGDKGMKGIKKNKRGDET
jgi:hypothetical protein